MLGISNQTIRLPIVPPTVSYYTVPGESKLDYPAICCFAALGFFLDEDTYYTNKKAFRPATDYQFTATGQVQSRKRYFEWHYSPKAQSFAASSERFKEILHRVVSEHTAKSKVILPISGGLDSRALAVTMHSLGRTAHSYSYQFEGGISENRYGKAIAEVLDYSFDSFEIEPGYLWNVIDQLAGLNGCYAEFINPRQMAIWKEMESRGNLFLLGHGGDLFFDGMGVPDDMPEDKQVDYLIMKMVKPSGLALGSKLWDAWSQSGEFADYLKSRFSALLGRISIKNANARLRAFKTEYYVARWTAVNLAIFQAQHPIAVPFFHDDFCRFVCETPEEHLAGRRLEIEYIKAQSPDVARIPWQKYYPCNLYNYGAFNSISVKLQRAIIKGLHIIKGFANRKSDARNWELQFMGLANQTNLHQHLFEKSDLFPREVMNFFWAKFRADPDANVQAITMLLTLSKFSKLFLRESGNAG